ncbi:sigma-54-dependent transcriptional regulator [Dendrosporobacter sp. 1207_IL3150]|uniref:sigma-54-dependent transcriptional regulator n=1 Tax=Dendrosporobacter sp. 1207_IL3150 TaxID=3084054 RepID=UPI002FD8C0DB
MNILLIDDDKSGRFFLSKFLARLGHCITECGDGQEALILCKAKQHFDMVLTDIKMPYLSGIDFLRQVGEIPEQSGMPIVLMSAHTDVDTAIAALRLGAYDYLVKPVNVNELTVIVERIAEYRALRSENTRLKDNLDTEVRKVTEQTRQEMARLKKIASRVTGLAQIGLFSNKMLQASELAKKFHSDRSIPVLIEGETGSGKEVIAKMVHHGSDINEAPFIDLNCAAITPSLFESDLFGYEAGAFTGGLAKGQKGKIEIAAGGTLFLDEVGEMPLELQAKLLRVLQEKQFYRVGGIRKVNTDVRVICATNANLEQKVKDGTFREDLYYRLKVGHIHIPPLRERLEDIMPLAELFIKEFCAQRGQKPCTLSKAAADMLRSHNWPGNVRELKNTIDLSTLLCDENELRPEHINLRPTFSANRPPQTTDSPTVTFSIPDKPFSLETMIDNIVLQVLELHGGNKTETARYLDISRRTLCYRLDKMKK